MFQKILNAYTKTLEQRHQNNEDFFVGNCIKRLQEDYQKKLDDKHGTIETL
jgi:hypothetical protein